MSPPNLLSTVLLFLLSTVVSVGKETPSPTPKCKAIPGTPAWPSAAAWTHLNESTGGRLLQPSPPGAVCHPGQPTYNASECAAVVAAGGGGWATYEFHSADPVSVDWNQWANDTCLPGEAYPCSPRGYPVFVVNASTAAHVQAGLQFARKNNIRVIVKSSGHDYLGRSVAPFSLSIWVHHLKSTPKTHTSFRPSGCNVEINSTAVTVAAGTQMEELYSFLDKLNQTTIGGGGKTVSLGGYLTGGGHGLLSPTHGLAADNVLEMEVVTPTGKIVIANECTNTDLFFAMRGGGGSTFGILTSTTLLTFPTPHLTSTITALYTPNLSSPNLFPMLAYILSQLPSLSDAGVSGYASFFTNMTSPLSSDPTPLAGIGLSLVLQDSPPSSLSNLLNPILEHINTTYPEEFAVVQIPADYDSFYGWYQVNYDQSSAGRDMVVGSRLLGREHVVDTSKVAEALREMALGGSGSGIMHVVAGRGVREAVPRGEGGDAVCPAWRRAYVHIANSVSWEPLNATARTEAMSRLNKSLRGVRELAPDMGAYMNEANPEEPNWQTQFWGSNYNKLLRIKRSIDPEDVLWCNPCVGNERWKENEDGQLCRV
ncbi:hypothetical protein QBC47DRAFT_143717 [Echria macrotheca]|uniref:FAD-binding PCMH-type domain-containing protein n=1 Tax=Echria macrotheca TaxID=438768 RepID=A0AAJ0BM97_9PEZI|nr:hypothetical protein QBC47DRAFT_143717 [Echria macrotheca]